jgi:hypothetical protein
MSRQNCWSRAALYVVLAALLVVGLAFAHALRARLEARRYLDVITQMPIGTTYDLAVRQLGEANIPVNPSSDSEA